MTVSKARPRFSRAERVLHQERDGKIPLQCFLPGDLDGAWCRIHSPDLVSLPGEEEGVLPRAAPDIEDVADDLPRRLEGHEDRLLPPDLPVRSPSIGLFEDAHAGSR